jgi:hypothetical protein
MASLALSKPWRRQSIITYRYRAHQGADIKLQIICISAINKTTPTPHRPTLSMTCMNSTNMANAMTLASQATINNVLLRQLQVRLQRLEVGQLPPALPKGVPHGRNVRHEDGLPDRRPGREVQHVRED